MRVVFLFSAIALALPVLPAAVTLDPVFGDHAVIQAGDDIPVWGSASDGERVTVRLAGVEASTVAAKGRWMVRLSGLKPASTAGDLVAVGTTTVTSHDVLVGEVWMCSGQSNMERNLGLRPPQQPIENWEQEAAAANCPTIRYFNQKRVSPAVPIAVAEGAWEVVTPASVINCTAVGYFFARALQQARPQPIGLIQNAWGGSTAEGWVSREALTASPDASLQAIVTDIDRAIEKHAAVQAAYKANEPALLAEWEQKAAAAKAAGQPVPGKPRAPAEPLSGYLAPLARFNGMLHPLIPLGLRGVLWYQGESNNGRYQQYETLLPTMIADWRGRWNRPDLPFLIVEVAPYSRAKPEFREAQQRIAASVPKVGIVTTVDVGDDKDIHPTRKKPVGERLALLARSLVYGETVVASGPRFTGLRIDGASAIVSFSDLGGGLVARDGALKGFVIAGADKKFVDASATIVGETVVVTAPGVAAPVAVRYAWAPTPVATLANQAGLPAFPFRSDR